MTLEAGFNYCEAGLWFIIAATLWARAGRLPGPSRKLGRISGVAFFFFGISDLVEAQTGAWWTPWWLFVLKAACVLVFSACGWKYWRRKKGEEENR